MAKFPSFFDKFGGSLISGGSSLISGIFGTISQNRMIDKQIKAQREENERMREYNLNLAKLQNQWNIDQWNRENEYNTPAAMMKRLREGKLNPDLMYQNGTTGLTSASSPSMTSGAPATPQDFSALGQKRTIGDSVQQSLRDSLLGAQIDVMKSEARKNNAAAGGQEITNESLAEMNEAIIKEKISAANKNEADRKKSEEMVNTLKSQQKVYEATVENIHSETGLNNVKITDISFNQYMRRAEYVLNYGKFAADFNVKMLELGYKYSELDALKKKWASEAYKNYVDANAKESDSFLNVLRFFGDFGLNATMRKNIPKLQQFWIGDNLDFSEFSEDNLPSTFKEELGDFGNWVANFFAVVLGGAITYYSGKGRKPKKVKGFGR
nr:MAG TPA: DNA pilot protein VP2 [Microviridae sp.]